MITCILYLNLIDFFKLIWSLTVYDFFDVVLHEFYVASSASRPFLNHIVFLFYFPFFDSSLSFRVLNYYAELLKYQYSLTAHLNMTQLISLKPISNVPCTSTVYISPSVLKKITIAEDVSEEGKADKAKKFLAEMKKSLSQVNFDRIVQALQTYKRTDNIDVLLTEAADLLAGDANTHSLLRGK